MSVMVTARESCYYLKLNIPHKGPIMKIPVTSFLQKYLMSYISIKLCSDLQISLFSNNKNVETKFQWHHERLHESIMYYIWPFHQHFTLYRSYKRTLSFSKLKYTGIIPRIGLGSTTDKVYRSTNSIMYCMGCHRVLHRYLTVNTGHAHQLFYFNLNAVY